MSGHLKGGVNTLGSAGVGAFGSTPGELTGRPYPAL